MKNLFHKTKKPVNHNTKLERKVKKGFDEFIAECKALALYDTGVTAEYGDKLITLSTCEYSRTNGRMVIVAKLVVPSAEEVDADAGH